MHDPQLAVECWTRAAACRMPAAYTKLGWAHFQGVGVKKDVRKALGYFSAAHELDQHLFVPRVWRRKNWGNPSTRTFPLFHLLCQEVQEAAAVEELRSNGAAGSSASEPYGYFRPLNDVDEVRLSEERWG